MAEANVGEKAGNTQAVRGHDEVLLEVTWGAVDDAPKSERGGKNGKYK